MIVLSNDGLAREGRTLLDGGLMAFENYRFVYRLV
jgi:hypothetical protein